LVLEEFELKEIATRFSLITYESELSNITSYLNQLTPNTRNVLVVTHKAQFLEQLLKTQHLIHAAGGLISTEGQRKLLCIFRKGKWDLPKGKIDEGEASDVAAWREVQEECGINSHVIASFFQSTYHFYIMKVHWVLKQTDWYLMNAAEEALIPQIEEDITQASWIPLKAIEQVYENTYPLIKDLIQAYHEKIS